MKRLFFIFILSLLSAGCLAQTRPRAEVDTYNGRFTCYREYGVNTSLAVTTSLYGKVRVITEGRPDLYVCFVRKGEAHKLNVRVVDREPNRLNGEWQFVTRKGDEDFTIRITDIFNADVSVLVTEGYDPMAKQDAK